MNSRERVIKALKHEQPDRVPLALGGSAYNINNEAYFRLVEYLGLPNNWPPFRDDGFKMANFLDERIQEILGVDFRYVYPPSPDLAVSKQEVTKNGWGQTLEKVGGFVRTYPTLAGATIKDIENYPWPDPRDYRPAPGTGERARAYQEAGLAVVARSVCSYGLLEQAGQLRGTEQFMVDMLLDEALARCLVDYIGNTIYGLMEVYLDEVGSYIDILELPGDDYGSQAGPIISPDLFKKYFRPWYRKLVDLVKSKSPGTYVLAHSDGFITPFIPGYIEAGIELLHPLQPGVGMDLAAVKREFGKDIAFIGGIDIQQALPAGPETAVEEVKKRLQELAPGGGYILAPANHIGPDVAPESIVAMYRAAAELGRY